MKNLLCVMVSAIALLFSCSDNQNQAGHNYSATGVAQKGPFVKGTPVIIAELDQKTLSPTGKTFTTETINDFGEFETKNVVFNSNIVEITATGIYYNEVSGGLSFDPITLKAITKLADNSTINVNLMTDLTSERIKSLVSKGQDFATAKANAENEILSIFNASGISNNGFESLDISNDGAADGLLIFVSAVFQGNLSGDDLTKLLSDFKDDFQSDGKIDNASIKTELLSNATNINQDDLRRNLENKYTALGETIVVPDFEQGITNFVLAGDLITYPASGLYGINILSLDTDQQLDLNKQYSLAATFTSVSPLYVVLRTWSADNAKWVTDPSLIKNWSGSDSIAFAFVTADRPITFTNAGTFRVAVDTWQRGPVFLRTKETQFTIK